MRARRRESAGGDTARRGVARAAKQHQSADKIDPLVAVDFFSASCNACVRTQSFLIRVCRPMAVGGPLRFASDSALRSVSGHVDSVFGSSSMITESGALQMATKNADLWKQLCIGMPRRDFAKDQCALPRAQRFDRVAVEPLIRGSAASSNSTDEPAMVTSATSTSSQFVSQTLPASTLTIKSSADTLLSVAAAVVTPTPINNTIAITFFALAGIVCIAAIALLIASQRESLNRI